MDETLELARAALLEHLAGMVVDAIRHGKVPQTVETLRLVRNALVAEDKISPGMLAELDAALERLHRERQ